MRLFRRRSPTDFDPQLTGLRFDASTAAASEDEAGKSEQNPNSDFINFEGITPKSARKLVTPGGEDSNYKQCDQNTNLACVL